MLVNAMGASKLEGPFRITCESVMRVMRDNQDPISAMMEVTLPCLNDEAYMWAGIRL